MAFAQRSSGYNPAVFSTDASSESVSFGIRAGVNFSNMRASASSLSLNLGSRTGFHVGVIADIPVVESFYIQPGLYLQEKGFKAGEWFGSELTGVDVKAAPLYLEVPILASFRFNVSRDVKIQANVGPYLAYGVGGKIKGSEGVVSVETDVFSDEGGVKRFDGGLSFGAGVQILHNYYIGFAYELGLVNIIDDDEAGGASLKNTNWMISLGYNF